MRRGVLAGSIGPALRLGSNRRGQTLVFNALRLDRSEVSQVRESSEIRFLAYVLAHRERSRAQILQDLWVCFELDDLRDGYFVEFGATDGKTNSNTWLLEKQFGWVGLLVEPNPVWHPELAANRSAAIDHRCVASTSGQFVEFVATDDTDPELSGIAAFSQGAHFEQARRTGTVRQIETISLNDVLTAHDAPTKIDYMSIDTEGSELEILQSFDFSAHRPTLLNVEFNERTEHGIQSLLTGHGYHRVFPHLSQWDSWYISDDIDRTRPVAYAPTA